MIIFLSTEISVFAIKTGDRIAYQSTDQVFSLIDEDGYIGTCALFGPPAKERGIAKATVFSHSNRTAKIAYHWGIELGWSGSKMNEPLEPGWAATKFWGLTAAIQASQMGIDKWEAVAGADPDGNALIRQVLVKAESLSDTPSNFVCIYGDAEEGYQNFVVFKMDEEPKMGSLKLRKASSIKGITG